MFIVDWSEEDFGDLNFYDMYDILKRDYLESESLGM